MAFYTFCERLGSRIYHRYVDDEGKRQQEIVSEFPFELFIKGKGEHRSLFNDQLARLTFDTVADANSFVREHESVTPIYGQTSLVHQFISGSYPGKIDFDFSKFRVLNFDIETRYDGCDDDELVKVRKSFSLEDEEVTKEYMMTLNDVWEVWDEVQQKWYKASECPQRNYGGFPAAKDADYEVLTISCKVFGSEKRVTFGTKEYTPIDKNQVYVRCEDERELLRRFIGFVRQVDPDVLTGWNIEWFDVPYIVNRTRKLLGEEMANKLSPFHAHTKKCLKEYGDKDDEDAVGFEILGMTVLDYYDLYPKYNPKKLDSYKLDFVSEIELDEKKVDLSEWGGSLMRLYQENFPMYVKYNDKDVYLVERLDEKKQFILLAITMVLMTKVQYKEVDGKVKLWDTLIYNRLKEAGIVLPPSPRVGPKEKIVGAYVKEPIPGKYRWVLSIDLTALYPTIAMMFNMSPETMMREEQGTLELLEKLLQGKDLAGSCRARNYCMTANGAAFRQDFEGVLPATMRYVFETRKQYKKLMLEWKRKKEAYLKDGGKKGTPEYIQIENMIAMADATQGAMKVLANSGYGVTANPAFRYFSKSIAQGITLTGQLVIQYIGNRINEFLNERFGTSRDYVITSDTDSCYLTLDVVPSDPRNTAQSVEEMDQFAENILQPFIDQSFKELSDRLGCKENLLDMKREAISDVGIWRRKKNYVCQVYDMEGVRYTTPELKMVGIETARTDKPKIVRDQLKEDLHVLLNGTEEQLLKRIDEFRKTFYNSTIETVAAPKGVSDLRSWADSERTYKPKAPYHVRAALAYNRLLREKNLTREHERIRNGNKIKLMALKPINPLRVSNIAFLNELPRDMGLHEYLDFDAQWEKTYITPLRSFTDILGWQTKKINTLESLFG